MTFDRIKFKADAQAGHQAAQTVEHEVADNDEARRSALFHRELAMQGAAHRAVAQQVGALAAAKWKPGMAEAGADLSSLLDEAKAGLKAGTSESLADAAAALALAAYLKLIKE